MRHGRMGASGVVELGGSRLAWRAWAGPSTIAIVDSDLATMLDRSGDAECGLRTPGRWRRRRW